MPKFHTICDLNEFLESFPWGRLTSIENVEFGDVVARFGDDENPHKLTWSNLLTKLYSFESGALCKSDFLFGKMKTSCFFQVFAGIRESANP